MGDCPFLFCCTVGAGHTRPLPLSNYIAPASFLCIVSKCKQKRRSRGVGPGCAVIYKLFIGKT